MRVLKFLAYLCLIGFIVDLFFKFFDYKKLKKDLEYMPSKSRLVVLVFACLVAVIGAFNFELALNIFGIIFIPVIITAMYFAMSEIDLDEKEEPTKSLD